MSTIGILTFHRAENIGAVFQAWALQNFLCSMGHDARIIDYRCPAIELQYDVLSPRILWRNHNHKYAVKEYGKRISSFFTRFVRKREFSRFRRDFFNLTPSVKTIEEIPCFDFYITGSDQVWNLAITNGFDRFYFLDFQVSGKIAYAASLEKSSLPSLAKNFQQVKSALNDFKSISVRESWIADELQANVVKPISVCVDPVFLLPSIEYKKIAILPRKVGYILVYHVVESKMASIVAGKMAEKHNLEVIELHSRHSIRLRKRNHFNISGPRELIGMILNANYIVTTSFHGMAFSLIFQKEFWVVDTGYANRQISILTELNLKNRIINNNYEINMEQIDYFEVGKKMNKIVNSSKKYLKENI